jgi:hypothetical protein
MKPFASTNPALKVWVLLTTTKKIKCIYKARRKNTLPRNKTINMIIVRHDTNIETIRQNLK